MNNYLTEHYRNAIVKMLRAKLTCAQIGERLEKMAIVDYTRSEIGSIEAEVCGIVRWNKKPALTVIERLSGKETTCVLSSNLADQLGPTHQWYEAWEGGRLLFGGLLHYAKDGSLKRIDAETAEELPWTDVTLAQLENIDILQGKKVTQHLRDIWGED